MGRVTNTSLRLSALVRPPLSAHDWKVCARTAPERTDCLSSGWFRGSGSVRTNNLPDANNELDGKQTHQIEEENGNNVYHRHRGPAAVSEDRLLVAGNSFLLFFRQSAHNTSKPTQTRIACRAIGIGVGHMGDFAGTPSHRRTQTSGKQTEQT